MTPNRPKLSKVVHFVPIAIHRYVTGAPRDFMFGI